MACCDALVFAVDLGGTHLRMALVDEAGNIHKQLKRELRRETLRIRSWKPWSPPRSSGPAIRISVAASIMVPGAVDSEKAVVLQAPNLPSLANFGLKAVLEQRLGWPVFLENDANAAAIGEMWLGAARGCRDVISVTLGTGVGGGVILDGKLWRGAHGSAGEIGHTTVDPFSGLKCKCGNTGCLEMFASATAIVRMTREDLSSYPQSSLSAEELTAEHVYEAGRNGDELALSVFKRFGMYLGVGLANLINLIDPEIIVIDWRRSERLGFVCAGDASGRFRSALSARHRQQVKIARAECGDNAGLLGAARLAFEPAGLQN